VTVSLVLLDDGAEAYTVAQGRQLPGSAQGSRGLDGKAALLGRSASSLKIGSSPSRAAGLMTGTSR
jgi:hypothetical protein